MQDALREALTGIKSWAKKGAARESGRRNGVLVPEDSDFPEAIEEQPEVEIEAEAAPVVEVEPDSIDPSELEQLLALMDDEEA